MEQDSVDRIVQAWHSRDPQLDASSLEVIGRLLLCAGHIERAVSAVLRPLGLSIADFDVLNTLRRAGDEHGGKPTDLARASLITTGAMTSRLDRLERSGLIRRTADPADRRGVLVVLTPQGSKVARQALDDIIAGNQAILAPLSEQQRASVASGLRWLLLHLESRDTRRDPPKGRS